MKLPDGVSFHGFGLRLGPGDELPDEVLVRLPEDHPLKEMRAAPEPIKSRKSDPGLRTYRDPGKA